MEITDKMDDSVAEILRYNDEEPRKVFGLYPKGLVDIIEKLIDSISSAGVGDLTMLNFKIDQVSISYSLAESFLMVRFYTSGSHIDEYQTSIWQDMSGNVSERKEFTTTEDFIRDLSSRLNN
jgi:hypothetical protein